MYCFYLKKIEEIFFLILVSWLYFISFSLYNKLKLFLILGAESKFYYNSAPNVRALII